MEEKFGVELELKTSKFSQKMEAMKSKIQSFAQTTKANFSTGMYLDTEGAQKELKVLESELQKISKSGVEWDYNGEELVTVKERAKDLRGTIAVIKSDLNTINTSKIAQLGVAFGKVKNSIMPFSSALKSSESDVNKLASSMEKSFNRGIKSVKRLALSLFSVRSIFAVMSRAMSAYLTENTELANKMQGVWIGLGAVIEPIVSYMANALINLIAIVNSFVKGLTGVDLLAKAMAMTEANTNSATQAIQKQKGALSGFDEITNIASDDSSSDSAVSPDTSWVSAFDNVNTEWMSKFEAWGSWVRDNWQFVVIGLTALASLITVLKVSAFLATIGLSSMLVPLLAIAVGLTGLTALVLGIIELFKEGGNETKAWTLILGGLAGIVLAVGLAFGLIPMIIAGVVSAVTAGVIWIIKNWDSVVSAISKGVKSITAFFVGLYNNVRSIFSSIGSFFSGIFIGIKNIFVSIGSTIGNAIGDAFAYVVNSVIGFAESTINGFIKAINTAIGVINAIPGVEIKKLSLLNIPKLATGTNYVPNDQLAYIHKGEAVVPKKFNSSEYFGRGNEETNTLLQTLINTVDSKDYATYLDSKKIGQSTVNYINQQNRQMGRSVI